MGGLEIVDTSSINSEISTTVERSGSFVHINPKPGTILVNVGYLLMNVGKARKPYFVVKYAFYVFYR